MSVQWDEMIRPILLAVILAAVSGCVTTKEVRIESDPPGAEIYVNASFVGNAPLTHPISDDETPGVTDHYIIEARLAGYRPAKRELRDRLGTSWIPERIDLKLAPRSAKPAAPISRQPSQRADRDDAPPPAETMSASVHASADWVSSGISVHAGARYRLTAAGRWRMAPGCAETDAAGTGLRTSLLCFSLGGEPLPGVNFQTLIGRIGAAGRPFAIGTRLDFTAKSAGLLYLRSNSNALFDNVGTITVAIARLDAPEPRRTEEAAPPRLPTSSGLALSYPKGPVRPDDIAVIIGNANYRKQGKDIPDATPAYADADGFRRYAMWTLGIREGNIIHLKDATSAQMVRVLGSDKNHKGQLFDWVKAGKSRVYVFYSGHGAPGTSDQGGAYLVPTDADGARIELNGYPLTTFYNNLAKLPAQSVTVVLEACFSGASDAGSVISNA